jgi:Zn-dependent peptidase ImmA (M78 family)
MKKLAILLLYLFYFVIDMLLRLALNYNGRVKIMMKPDPQEAAETILNICWEENRFPVDPVNIAKQLGIKVLKSKLPPEVSAAIVKEMGKDPVIYLHEYDSNNRKRFSCAHELGHYVHRLGEENYRWIDLRDKMLSPSATDEIEIFANQFAANLLMPEDEVRKRIKHSKLELTTFFGISGEAMKWRLRNLSLRHSEFLDQ